MARKRNPIKQIMSEVHKDARDGGLDLGGHGGFIAEVRRRARLAGLDDADIHEVVSSKGHSDPNEQQSEGRRA
jgi:hypothetical protein